MSLLSADTVTKIFDAIQKTTDTFLKVPVRIRVRKANTDVWVGSSGYDDYDLLSLKVVSSDTKKVDFSEKGAFDNQQSYVLFNYSDLENAGLVVNGELMIVPNQDLVVINDKKYKITTVVEAGFLVNQYAIAKIFIQETL